MEKILLINPPGKYHYLRDQYCSSSAKAGYYWPAVDLLVLSGILSRDFNVCVLDAIVENFDARYVLNLMSRNNFKAVIALTSSASMEEDFFLFDMIKRSLGITVIVNGGFVRSNPLEYLKKFEFLDAIILDYTEDGILEFLKGQSGNLAGLCYRKGFQIFEAAGSRGHSFKISYPIARHELFPLKKYYIPQAKRYPFSCVLSAAGCAYQCKFCSSSNIALRLRDISNLTAELKFLTNNLGIREAHFPDFTFTANRSHCVQICEMILKETIDIGWDCLTRVDCFDGELAKIMKQAGCHTIQFGVESKNEEVLRKLAKPISNKMVRDAFSECRKQGIETIGFFIIGLPGEDEKSIHETINFAQELNCDFASFSVFVPDFGTHIRRELEMKDPAVKDIHIFDRVKFPVLGNEFLSRQEIWDLRNQAVRKFYFRIAYFWKCLKKIKNFVMLKGTLKIFWSLLKQR